MKLSKRKKTILLLVSFFYIALILMNWFSESIDATFIENTLTTITLLSGFFTFVYNFVDFVFLKTNKVLMVFNRDTVSWKSQYKFFVSSEIDFEKMNYSFLNSLKDKGYEISKFRNSNLSCSFILTKGGYDRHFNIFSDYFENYTQIRVSYSSSTSYKDSKNEINKFFEVLEIYTKSLAEVTVTSPTKKRSLYSATISFQNSNPFYKLVVRHTDDTADVIFNLSFSEGNANINIEKNKLSISSPDKEEIISILTEYLVLSSID